MLFTVTVFIAYFCGLIDGQFKGLNIAINESAIQLPNDWCEDLNPGNFCYTADLAVDGKFDPAGAFTKHCTHTSLQTTTGASWTVDFSDFHYITGIVIYHRGDRYKQRLRNFSVDGINGTTGKTTFYTANNTIENFKIDIELSDVPYVSGIQIRIPHRTPSEETILTLCEVQVYSDISCSQPELENYTRAKYTDGFNHGSIATFTCMEGYETDQPLTMECKGWRWIGIPPKCQIVYCSYPLQIQNGNYNIISCPQSKDNDLQFNCSVMPICDTGFNLTRGNIRYCNGKGEWSGETPTCARVKCTIPFFEHGYYTFFNESAIVQTRVDYETKIIPKCEKGYNHSNTIIRSCQQDGTWNGTVPECVLITCDHPGNDSISNGYYIDDSGSPYLTGQMNYAQRINARCSEGYKITNDSDTRSCQEDTQWSEINAKCNIVNCSSLATLDNVIYDYTYDNSSQLYPFGTMVNVRCVNGKIPDGSTIRRCTAFGTWDGYPSTCGVPSQPAGLIGGVVGAAVAAVLIAIVIVLLTLKRRGLLWRQRKPETPFYDLENLEHNTSADDNKESVVSISNGKEEQNKQSVSSENTYVQFPQTAIFLKDLANLVLSEKAVSEKFKEQYEALPHGMHEKHLEALKPHNKGKNRYKGLYAYDSSRVVLETDSEEEHDYINACYVNGFERVQAYIASQGPTKEILIDFWRMVWQTKCRKIVMLTNLKELGKPKCEQYWPDEGDIFYGNVVVTMKAAEHFCDFIIRKFTIKKGNFDEREVVQYHYTAWPDKGVPKFTSSLVQFRNKVKSDEKPGEGPIVVHCSAGVGRTGTFIALDYLTDFAKTMDYVDVFGCVETLRRQRVNLVQTLEQYVFLHGALVETLMIASSALPSFKFESAYQNLLEIDGKTKKRKLEQQFERRPQFCKILRKLSPVTAEDQYVSAKDVRNRNKNRYSNILPVETFMPTLTPGYSKDDEYVNAVFLPSYKEKNAFIVTQTPLETTREDFWKLVWEYNIHTIVMMNSILEMHKSEIYWPEEKEAVQFGSISISTDNTMAVDEHNVITLNITSFSQTRQIKLIQCGGWKPGDNLPESPNVMLSVLELVLSWQQKTGNQTILAHCMNGAERSGLFCVISAVIDRMKVEQDVAISSIIEDMRNAREQIIPNVWQYKYCHDVVLAYIKMNETYSNFTI